MHQIPAYMFTGFIIIIISIIFNELKRIMHGFTNDSLTVQVSIVSIVVSMVEVVAPL